MKYLLITMIAIAGVSASEYRGAFLNLPTPVNGISGSGLELAVNHRFFGYAFKNDPLETFFGLDNGANVSFDIRYFPADDFYLKYGHTRLWHRNTISAGMSYTAVQPLQLLGEVGYTSIKPGSAADWEGGLLATLSASAWLLKDRVRPVVNFAYDGNREESGPGFGLEVTLTDNISVSGEYFPAAVDNADNDCFSFAGRYSTWGHQFILGLSNSAGIGPWDQLAGSSTGDVSVAFSIRRMF